MKKHLWGCLEKDLGKKAKETHTFQDLVSKTVTAMPKGECENLSAAVAWTPWARERSILIHVLSFHGFS